MNSFKPLFSYLTVLYSTLLLVACGGGGGGGDSQPTINIPTAGVSITTSNAEKITAGVIGSVDAVQGLSSATDLLTGVTVETSGGVEFGYADLALLILNQLPTQSVTSSYTNVNGLIITDTQLCPDGGSVTETKDVTSLSVWTPGDMVTYTFSNCALLGITLNGTTNLTINQVNNVFPNVPAVPPYLFNVDMLMTSFSMSDGITTLRADGDMSILFSVDINNFENLEISGDSLTATVANEGEILSSYLYDIQVDNLTGNFSVDLQGTIASTEIGGSVSYQTTTTFTGNDSVANGNPTVGVLLITTSLNSTKARATALTNGVDVLIEVDTDGNGSFETLINTTWDALESL